MTVSTFTTGDGLSLAFASEGEGPPVLCLNGLTRNMSDFEDLAEALASQHRMIRLDSRGRGQSDYDDEYLRYNPLRETQDVLELVDHLGLDRFSVVGTSRGGVLAMLIAMLAPGRLTGVVLNDIGPVLEAKGLERIMKYLGVDPDLDDWDEATEVVRGGLSPTFHNVSDSAWRAYARRTFRDEAGRPAMNYDPRLRDAVIEQAPDMPADLWPQFRALASTPVLAIRGALSDLMSAETLAAMQAERPDMAALVIRDRGHAPFLDEPEAVAAISVFLQGLNQ